MVVRAGLLFRLAMDHVENCCGAEPQCLCNIYDVYPRLFHLCAFFPLLFKSPYPLLLLKRNLQIK